MEEISVYPPFVEEVDTTISAFVGYSAKAIGKDGEDLRLVPTKINSIREYECFFGSLYESDLELSLSKGNNGKLVIIGKKEMVPSYHLYDSVSVFFENGGVCCYIVSVGLYQNPPQFRLRSGPDHPAFGLLDGLNRLESVSDLSLLVIPEAVNLMQDEYATLVQATLKQCASLGNRLAIFDLYQGDCGDPDLSLNRGMYGSVGLNSGCVYYPFVRIVRNFAVNIEESNVSIVLDGVRSTLCDLKNSDKSAYKFIRKALTRWQLRIPCSGAIAGAYVATDLRKGVWKSPANLNLAGVEGPVVAIDNKQQELLNVDPDQGKSINSIREFPGRGTLVWGARTLAGNDCEWRYVPVRRFFIMVQESLIKSTQWVIYEPNDSATWMRVRAMIESYLTLKWQNGALAGIFPHTAFYVKCGAGITMTRKDILEGRTIVEVGLAMIRPSDYIVLRFSQQLIRF